VFVVARAYSKLAEVDPLLVDLSVLFRVCTLFDAKANLLNEDSALQALLARTIAKTRWTASGEMMIKILCEQGVASRIVVAGAISLSEELSTSVYYLTEFEQRQAGQAPRESPLARPPSRRLLGELFGLNIDQDPSVQRALRSARQELEHAFPGIDFPYPLLWAMRRVDDVPYVSNGPFLGVVATATLATMSDLGGRLDVSNLACLAEPRVVEALFDNCGGMLLLDQDPESPRCRRLRDRGVPFALLHPETLADLEDGDHVAVEEGHLRILRSP
jgi:hypothetical protein